MAPQTWISLVSAALTLGAVVYGAGVLRERLDALVRRFDAHAEKCEERHGKAEARTHELELFRARHEANGKAVAA